MIASSELSNQVFFELPESPIKAPVISPLEEKINMALVEIGCKPQRKRGQLKEKRQGIYTEWGHFFRNSISWRPLIYKILVYFDDMPLEYANPRLYEPELILHYTSFPSEVWYNITEEDKQWVIKYERKTILRKEFIQIMDEKTAEEAYAFVIGDTKNKYKNFRGRLLELIVAKDIERAISEDITLYKNPELAIFYKGALKKVEIDDILLFYGDSPFNEFTSNLEKQSHIELTKHLKKEIIN